MTDFASIAAEFTDDPLDTPRHFEFRGPVQRWMPKSDGVAVWFFMVIDGDVAEAITGSASVRRGFRSVRVQATIGKTAFATSLFPMKSLAGLMLPLKASVRKAEGLVEGSVVEVVLELL